MSVADFRGNGGQTLKSETYVFHLDFVTVVHLFETESHLAQAGLKINL